MQLILALLLILTCMADAHVAAQMHSFGFLAGMKHPIQGIDHLLAMLCVGLISSRIGERALWQVPACFVLIMALGCGIGFFGTSIRFIEPMIAASVIVFGGLLLFPNRLSLLGTLITVALFAMVHGYAHGKDMPIFVLPEIYILGFIISTTGIHLIGVFVGELMNLLPFRQRLYQVTGIALIVSGGFLLFI